MLISCLVGSAYDNALQLHKHKSYFVHSLANKTLTCPLQLRLCSELMCYSARHKMPANPKLVALLQHNHLTQAELMVQSEDTLTAFARLLNTTKAAKTCTDQDQGVQHAS